MFYHSRNPFPKIPPNISREPLELSSLSKRCHTWSNLHIAEIPRENHLLTYFENYKSYAAKQTPPYLENPGNVQGVPSTIVGFVLSRYLLPCPLGMVLFTEVLGCS